MHWRNHTHQKGMTLIEALVSITIFAIVSVSFYMIINLTIKLVRDDQARLDAVSVAQSVVEQIHNAPYDAIGTINGIPNGSFPQTQTQIHNKTRYTVTTDIRYVDDPFDGILPNDPISTDYKKIRVAVTWEGQYVSTPVVLVTTISPDGIETAGSGGTLWIQVYDASTAPITNATVHITNPTVIPAIDIVSATDAQGQMMLPGAPASVQGYNIVVSKNGYSTTQTYTADSEQNPNPDPSDLTVTNGEVTQKILYIDKLSSLTIHAQDVESALPTANLQLHIVGNSRIGTALDGTPIAKYDETHTTNANGDITLSSVEYDSYTITIDDADSDLAGMSAALPIVIAPNTTNTLTLETAPDAANTLLLTVRDASGNAITDASVLLANASNTVNITQNTNTNGQTFFTPLVAGTYTVTVTHNSYGTFQDSFDVTDDVVQTIPLTANP